MLVLIHILLDTLITQLRYIRPQSTEFPKTLISTDLVVTMATWLERTRELEETIRQLRGVNIMPKFSIEMGLLPHNVMVVHWAYTFNVDI